MKSKLFRFAFLMLICLVLITISVNTTHILATPTPTQLISSTPTQRNTPTPTRRLLATPTPTPTPTRRPTPTLSSTVTLITTINGNINGVQFIGQGTGIGYPREGRTTGVTIFDKFPSDYTPSYGKCWKCVHHKSMALEISGGMNLYTLGGGNYDSYYVETYPTGETITVTAQVRTPQADLQIVTQNRTGTYTGPTDVVELLPFELIMHPAGHGKIVIDGDYNVVRSNGSQVNVKWYEEIYFVDPSVELPFEQILTFNPIKAIWSPENLKYETEMIVTVRPRATPTPTREVTPTPTSTGSGGYIITYTIQSDWGTGATINVTIKNNTTAVVNGWTLAFTLPGNQTITNLWNGAYTQSGTSVSVKDGGFNANIPAGSGSVNFGFNLNYSGTNAKPASFTLNGTPCLIQ
jgi:hypothetical protein